MTYQIRHKKAASDTVMGTWVYYDVLARMPERGWVKIGEVGSVTAYGWDSRAYDGTTMSSGYQAQPTRRDASDEVVQAFLAAIRQGVVDPATFVYHDSATRDAAKATGAAPSAAPMIPALVIGVSERYVLVADPGMPLFAQVIGQSDHLDPLLEQVGAWGPFEREEVSHVTASWTQGQIIRRYGNPSRWGLPRGILDGPLGKAVSARLGQAINLMSRMEAGEPSGLFFEIVDMQGAQP